jgi:hypothetical protein
VSNLVSNLGRALVVAVTDVDLQREVKDAKRTEIQRGRGELKWLADASTATSTNAGEDATRFALLQMRYEAIDGSFSQPSLFRRSIFRRSSQR